MLILSRIEQGKKMDDQWERRSIQDEGSYVCDSCGEEIVIPLDLLAGRSQEYVEDCPVCCVPHLIHVELDEENTHVWAEPEQDRYS
ncbi:MAG: CPXCG motif-containing cysteine-rich protein [Planctomycetota bacterium]